MVVLTGSLGALVDAYAQVLASKAPGTTDAYLRALRQFITWLAQRPAGVGYLRPEQLTKTAVETYLAHLRATGYSVSTQARAKAAISGFAQWLIEEQELLQRNPTRGVALPAQPLLAPRQLSPDQRYVLRELVERDGAARSAALFALGYWAGCRVSDVSWLRREDVHSGPKVGWVHVGYKGGKARDLDLVNQARRPLQQYLVEQAEGRAHNGHGNDDANGSEERYFLFTSQRSARLTERGIHHWLQRLRERATKVEWDLVGDVTYHDLRHDFAHRAREAGWTLEEVAYYLGHVTNKGTPAIQTTVRYTQVSREQVREKLRLLQG